MSFRCGIDYEMLIRQSFARIKPALAIYGLAPSWPLFAASTSVSARVARRYLAARNEDVDALIPGEAEREADEVAHR